MSRVRAAAFVFLFVAGAAAAIAPGAIRYGARIDLNRCERALLAAPSLDAGRRRRLLAAVREELDSVASRSPDDVRPFYLLGTSALLAGEPGEAIEELRRALAIEERPETDMNLSRAHAAAGDAESAAQDALRAVWLSPELLRDLDDAAKGPVSEQISALDRDLRSGTASAIPAIAKSDAPVSQDHR